MFAEKLKELRKEKGITQVKFAEIFNISSGTIAMWETEKRMPDIEMLQKIADYFNVSLDWLTGANAVELKFTPHEEVGDDSEIACPICGSNVVNFSKVVNIAFNNEKSSGVGFELTCYAGHEFYYVIESYKGNTYLVLTDKNGIYQSKNETEYESFPVSLETLLNDEIIKKYRTLDKHGKKIVDLVLDEECERCSTGIDLDDAALIMINYIDAPVSAGLGDILNDYEDTRKVSVPLTKESRKADFILKVDGDSMEPEFCDGDFVLVRQQPAIDEGQIGIFDVDGKGYIKKLGKNRLISLNPNYSDIVLNEYTDARCFGLVLGTTDIVDI